MTKPGFASRLKAVFAIEEFDPSKLSDAFRQWLMDEKIRYTVMDHMEWWIFDPEDAERVERWLLNHKVKKVDWGDLGEIRFTPAKLLRQSRTWGV